MRFLIALLVFLIAQPGWTATTTERHVLGFSKDGRYFVFEEFAVGDGAGIPYAALFVIDTKTDTWAPDSPFKTNFREGDFPEQPSRDWREVEREMIVAARKDVRKRAEALLQKIGPLVPGKQRVRNTVYDFSNDPRRAQFSPRDHIQSLRNSRADDKWRLDLVPLEFPPREDCYGLADKMQGFRLVLTEERSGKTRTLAEDKRIPKSRPCPMENFVEEVITYRADENETVLAVLIRFAHPGFEGADGSLLAVTARVKQ